MSQLTQKQESFCIAYIKTANATEVYRQVYNCSKMKPATVNRNAKALLDNNKIVTRLQELRAPVIAEAQITLAAHLEELRQIRDQAIMDRNWPAAIAAEVNRGKVSGLYVRKIEGVTPEKTVVNVVLQQVDPVTNREIGGRVPYAPGMITAKGEELAESPQDYPKV